MMNPPVNFMVRQAVEGDLQQILKIVASVIPIMNEIGNFQWDINYPLEKDFALDISKGELWVAIINNDGIQVDDTVVGMMALVQEQPQEYAVLDWDFDKKSIVPHRLAVNPEFKGKGISKLLLNFAEEYAISRSIDRIRIDTCTINPITMNLFPALGYSHFGEVKLNDAPQQLDFACFEKVLTA